MIKRIFLILLICALGLAACVRSMSPAPDETAAPPVDEVIQITQVVDETPPARSPDILGVTWLWQAFTQADSASQETVPNPADYTLLLNPDGTFLAKVDCNQVTGSYGIDGNNLGFELGISTQAACGPESLFDQFLAILSQAAAFEVIEGQLFLVGQSGQMAFLNGGMAESAAPAETAKQAPLASGQATAASLVNTLWQWTGLMDAATGSQSAIEDPEKYNIVFFKDGFLRVKADCNTAVGEYTSDEASLAITLGAMSMAACEPGSLSNQFVEALGQVDSYQINENQLVLVSAADASQLTFSSAGQVLVVKPAAMGKPSMMASQPVVVRSAPAADSPEYGLLLAGVSTAVAGKSPDAAWYAIALPNELAPSGLGWVSAAEVSLYNAEPADLPVIE